MGRRILSVDLGTTYFKTTLFDEQGRLVGLERVAPPIKKVGGWWDLDAAAFRQTISQSILAMRAKHGLDEVGAVVFSTQTNSFLLLGEGDEPLTPIILWPDLRAADMKAEARSLAEMPGLTETTGLPLLTERWMAVRFLWIQKHQPEIWRRMRRVCQISDYFTLWLTGQHVTEAGATGLTGLIDIHACKWWPSMCERVNVDAKALPAIARAGTDLGPLRRDMAAELGLPASCHFVVGCLDQYAGAVGVGNIYSGGVSETTGTVLATVRCSDQFRHSAARELFQGPSFSPDLYFQMAFGDTSASILEWYRNQLPDQPNFESLGEAAARVASGAEGLTFRGLPLPEKIEDAFVGMTAKHTRGHAVRCIMETVAEALARQVACLCGGEKPELVRAAGGAARSDLWLQIKADRLGVAVAATQCPEPTSLGAACLAVAGLKWMPLSEVVGKWVALRPAHRPTNKKSG